MSNYFITAFAVTTYDPDNCIGVSVYGWADRNDQGRTAIPSPSASVMMFFPVGWWG